MNYNECESIRDQIINRLEVNGVNKTFKIKFKHKIKPLKVTDGLSTSISDVYKAITK